MWAMKVDLPHHPRGPKVGVVGSGRYLDVVVLTGGKGQGVDFTTASVRYRASP